MKLSDRLIVKPGTKASITKRDTNSTPGFKHRQGAMAALARNMARLAELQYLLYAENRRAILIVFQAMDAGGKDGTIRHVMSSLNPQGCLVTPFKAPSAEEAAHDFLWRVHKAAPRRGEFAIFNRSHYEDVLIARVHGLVPKKVWSKRYEQINCFEKTLAASDVTILKFFLHISKGEQKKRFMERIEDPSKHWKLSPADFTDRDLWDEYQKAYEDALTQCSTDWAPWYIIPADKKWFRNLAVSQIIVEALEDLGMEFPKPTIDLSKINLK